MISGINLLFSFELHHCSTELQHQQIFWCGFVHIYFRMTSSNWKSSGATMVILKDFRPEAQCSDGAPKPQKLLSSPKQSTSMTFLYTGSVPVSLDFYLLLLMTVVFCQSDSPAFVPLRCCLWVDPLQKFITFSVFVSWWFPWKVIIKTLGSAGLTTQAAFGIIVPKWPKSKALLFVFLTRAALDLCNKGCQDAGPLTRMTHAVCCDKLFVY